jgi:AraC-like DNA-binding protein
VSDQTVGNILRRHGIGPVPERSQTTTWRDSIRRHTDVQAFRIDDLARQAGMSTSSFRQWFRGITGMSPLQYQKQLRLQEARSILRNERKDVGTVSRCVGYASSSQFSREYRRLFGTPPVSEISKRNSPKAGPDSAV